MGSFSLQAEVAAETCLLILLGRISTMYRFPPAQRSAIRCRFQINRSAEVQTSVDKRAGQVSRPTGHSISETSGKTASVIETRHARHSKYSNSGNPPTFGIERTRRMVAPQLGQHGTGRYSCCIRPPTARAFQIPTEAIHSGRIWANRTIRLASISAAQGTFSQMLRQR
jgi:hypothetical protein